MKNKLILFACLILCKASVADAQPYQSIFGTNSTEWVYISSNLWGYVHDTIYIEKDTLINSKTYKKIRSKANLFPFFALREDISSGKVWHLKENSCEDLQFDFSLQQGDTFLHTYQGPGYPDSCGIVDSVRTINGLKHIYFKCGLSYANSEPITFIEGIGSNMNIVVNICNMGTVSKSYLLCSYKDDLQTTYWNRNYEGACKVYTNIKPLSFIENDISLYPQPASHSININNNSNQPIVKAIIISPTGTILKQYSGQELINSINIDEFPSGYYFIKLFTNNGYSITKAMIIK